MRLSNNTGTSCNKNIRSKASPYSALTQEAKRRESDVDILVEFEEPVGLLFVD